jgi:hypothetical protein
VSYRVEFSPDQGFNSPHTWSTNVDGTRLELDPARFTSVVPAEDSRLWWRVISQRSGGETAAEVPPAWFRLDPAAAPLPALPELRAGPDGELVVHTLRDAAAPTYGSLQRAVPVPADAEGVVLNGRDQMVIYDVPVWPEDDFTAAVRVRIAALPEGRIGQVFSAWAASMDDPLRLVIERGRLHARIEAGGVFSTPGTVVKTGRWYDVAAVKQGGQLTLFVDGVPTGSSPAPGWTVTRARDAALGGNPHFGGNEFLAARFADFGFFARALSPEEIRTRAWVRSR